MSVVRDVASVSNVSQTTFQGLAPLPSSGDLMSSGYTDHHRTEYRQLPKRHLGPERREGCSVVTSTSRERPDIWRGVLRKTALTTDMFIRNVGDYCTYKTLQGVITQKSTAQCNNWPLVSSVLLLGSLWWIMKRCEAGRKQLPIILTQSQHIYVILTLILSLASQEVSVNSLHAPRYTAVDSTHHHRSYYCHDEWREMQRRCEHLYCFKAWLMLLYGTSQRSDVVLLAVAFRVTNEQLLRS